MTNNSESEYLSHGDDNIFIRLWFFMLNTFSRFTLWRDFIKKKIGLLFFIFFIKKSPIIFILFYEIFNFLVNSLKSIIKSKWNYFFSLDQILSSRVWKYTSSIAQEVAQVKSQENAWNTTTSPYIRPHGGILISRFCLIMPSVSPIMVTRLFSSLYCVSMALGK